MGKRNDILAVFRGKDENMADDRSVPVVASYDVATSNGMRVKLRGFNPSYSGPWLLAQTIKYVDGRKVYELRDDFELLDRARIPYVGFYVIMKDGNFDHFMSLDEALKYSHDQIVPGLKKLGYIEGAITFGPYMSERSIVPMYAFFVESKSYVTDSRWLANQLSGNQIYNRDFVFIGGKIDHLARLEDYGEGDETIVDEEDEEEEEE